MGFIFDIFVVIQLDTKGHATNLISLSVLIQWDNGYKWVIAIAEQKHRTVSKQQLYADMDIKR